MADSNIYLALDLGTKTGHAFGKEGMVISGVWDLKPGRFKSSGMRYLAFRSKLDEFYKASPFGIVFFEEVRRHRGVDAAHVYGGLLGVLQGWCEERGVQYCGVPVGQIKKNWCGSGNASKDMMIEEAKARGFEPVDDNEADALAILDWALGNYAPTAATKEAAE